jgi:NAD(P)-dependent dehydrogenase (short-subunit alcohol dehydrogenase family)
MVAGIGLMMAKALANAGAARVYIVGRRVDVLQQAANAINCPAVVVPLYCDVTSKVSLESIVSVVETDVGFLNLLVCNAGVGGPQVKAPGPETTLDEWRDQQMSYGFDEFTNTFKVNSTSVWYTSMAFLKLLDNGNKKANVMQSSQVVVTSSIGAFNKKAPGGWAYGPSKAAATHIAKQLSVVLPTWNIRWVVSPFSGDILWLANMFSRANCICPGCKDPFIMT